MQYRHAPDQRQLPTFYYHTHFLELLEFVADHYRHVLSTEDARLIDAFRTLDVSAQRLYVRLVNRKGRIFAVNKLRYPELGELERPLQSLRTAGWVGRPGPELFEDILGFLTKAELQACLTRAYPGLGRSWKKSQLVGFVVEHCEPASFVEGVSLERLLVQRRDAWVRFLLFLYFGECRDGLSKFTLRDMGLVRTHAFRASYEPRFAEREEALQTYFFAARLKRLERGATRDREALLDDTEAWPEPASGSAAELRDRLAYAIGRHLERAGRIDTALGFYARGDSPACSERLIRGLLATGARDAARGHLEACMEHPRSEEEWLFANDLFRQKFGNKRTSALTDVLRAAEVIELDEAHSGAPERAAIEYYTGRGLRAWRAENTLWRSLFGLLFWDELFLSDSAALHSPFEALPASLRERTFYDAYAPAVEAKLAGLADATATRRRLLQSSARHYGTPNGVFRWRRSTLETVFALLDSAGHEAIAAMLRHMCRDYPGTRYGFPDLLLIDEAGVRFVEIKTDGDQLRRTQLLRLQQLRAAGLRADVVRVRWVLDPRQTYVVVDIETTGGAGEQHRVTEVAAVKIRDGAIVDRFQSLVNPQRPIPPNITRLTGISDAMVASAPRFADIADAFTTFMGDAIFVAHNVNFDYGFLSREYARLGKQFRYARLCTCASMRKLYPGHGSYSLAALCRRYDIALQQHHRAMCDAEAAAELLLLVNERRAEHLRT
jgi:DNA polymerase-3 subunit epsilon